MIISLQTFRAKFSKSVALWLFSLRCKHNNFFFFCCKIRTLDAFLVSNFSYYCFLVDNNSVRSDCAITELLIWPLVTCFLSHSFYFYFLYNFPRNQAVIKILVAAMITSIIIMFFGRCLIVLRHTWKVESLLRFLSRKVIFAFNKLVNLSFKFCFYHLKWFYWTEHPPPFILLPLSKPEFT